MNFYELIAMVRDVACEARKRSMIDTVQAEKQQWIEVLGLCEGAAALLSRASYIAESIADDSSD